MPIHLLKAAQIVPATLEECWAFFSNPRNLTRITPPAFDFQVLSDLPPTIYPGMMTEYRVRPLLGIPMTWLTEITQVEPQRHFVDEQRIGPYAIWHHEHFFTALDDNRAEIRDVVHYVLPFGWLGNLVHPFLVEPELRKIFAFRERAVTAIFGEVGRPGERCVVDGALRTRGRSAFSRSCPKGRHAPSSDHDTRIENRR